MGNAPPLILDGHVTVGVVGFEQVGKTYIIKKLIGDQIDPNEQKHDPFIRYSFISRMCRCGFILYEFNHDYSWHENKLNNENFKNCDVFYFVIRPPLDKTKKCLHKNKLHDIVIHSGKKARPIIMVINSTQGEKCNLDQFENDYELKKLRKYCKINVHAIFEDKEHEYDTLLQTTKILAKK